MVCVCVYAFVCEIDRERESVCVCERVSVGDILLGEREKFWWKFDRIYIEGKQTSVRETKQNFPPLFLS